MKKIVRLLVCSLPLLILAACGGGSGDPPTAASPGAAPTVRTITPADGDAGVIASTAIKVTFSKAMNPATVTASSPAPPGSTGTFTVSYLKDVVVFDVLGNATTISTKVIVAGTLAADPSNTTFTFQPSSPLPTDVDPNTGEHLTRTFTVTIKGGVNGVKEAGGTAMIADSITSFNIWAGTQQLGTVFNDVVNGVGTDGDNNIYLAGFTNGSLGVATNPDGSGITSDIMLVKYDVNGARVWTRQLGSQTPDGQPGPFDDKILGSTVDNSSGAPQIVAVGYTDGTLNQLSQPSPVEVNPDATGNTHNYCVVKYDADGNLKWATQAGSSASSIARAVATDTSGNIYVTGETYGDLRNGASQSSTTATSATPYSTVGNGKAAVFIAKYDSNGNLLKTVLIGSTAGDIAYGIAVDSNTTPNVYITGKTAGTLPLSASAGSVFVSKFNANLVQQKAWQFGVTANDHANAITVDSFGFVYVVGGTYGNLFGTNQGPDPLGNTTSDAFVVKFDPTGTVLFAQQLGTAFTDEAYSVVTDLIGSVYITGTTYGGLDGNSWSGGADIFVTKFTQNSGNVTKQWTRQLGSPNTDVGTAVSAFNSGVLYVGGYTAGNLDSNANQDANFNTTDYFLAKYDGKAGLKY